MNVRIILAILAIIPIILLVQHLILDGDVYSEDSIQEMLFLIPGVPILVFNFWVWLVGAVLLGIGTALVYPTLLAAVSDVAHPNWRASAVGVYRLWRDMGYAVGALTVGLLADAFGGLTAIAAIGVLTFVSGVILAAVMRETYGSRSNGTTLVREQSMKKETIS